MGPQQLELLGVDLRKRTVPPYTLGRTSKVMSRTDPRRNMRQKAVQPSSKPNPSLTAEARFCSVPQIPFRRLHGGMAQQQLDLLQISAGPTAQLGAGMPQIMGRELSELGLPGIASHQAPDDLFVQDASSLHQVLGEEGNQAPASQDQLTLTRFPALPDDRLCVVGVTL